MSDRLQGLEPALVWERFEELTRIARPPKAKGRLASTSRSGPPRGGSTARADEAGNVVVSVPASPGREAGGSRRPAVAPRHGLRARSGAARTTRAPGAIGLVVDGDWVAADGTTLGADNGIGVAAALAIADEAGRARPLELLFTVSEEEGLEGAKALDPSLVGSRRLVNLDGTSDDAITVGCAGSDHTFLRLALAPSPSRPRRSCSRIELSGARGGHSGADIAKGRANAIKALGTASSARPSSASRSGSPRSRAASAATRSRARPQAVVAVPARSSASSGRSSRAPERVRRRFAADDGVKIDVEEATASDAADLATTQRALDLVAAIPTGVVALAPACPESSRRARASRSRPPTARHSYSRRWRAAPMRAALDDLLATCEALARLGGAELEVRRSYPPWEPRLDSGLLAAARSTYAALFAQRARARGRARRARVRRARTDGSPGVEMISIGPEIVGPHAPGEKLRISSTQRFYRSLGGLLAELSR